ncbi:hypothetical protein ACCC92_02835 [Mucilaginibacter sp. Mucisp84]|uniref:hypothetical protein n=1 Tax=Mucilaginibacter sp. Mucisp84 TaxID=3243058 RepID=UPI0039A42C73
MKYTEEIFVRASLNVILTQPGSLVPCDFGTGCIVLYKGRSFFLSVSHVTKKGLDVYIEPNQPHDGKTSPIIPIGEILSYSYFVADEDLDADALITAIESGGEEIDFSVAEIKEPFDLLQNDIDFQSFQVAGGNKIFPMLEDLDEPDHESQYGFFGYINQDMNGIFLQRLPEIKAPLTYHRFDGNFYIFKARKPIKSREEYAGLSGAPIFNYQGRLVGLACAVRPRYEYGLWVSNV